MPKRARTLTAFGRDLDLLLKQAGKLTIREYADEAGVDYKYISQLRRIPNRRPGRLYVHLLRPFTRLEIVGLDEAHQLSLRHRGKPLSLKECQEIFPDLPEQELVESVKRALEPRDQKATHVIAAEPKETGQRVATPQPPMYSPLYRRVFVGREVQLRQLQSGFDGAMSGQGSLAMVVGEPGIGKTALCEQLSTYVSRQGGRTLMGHCRDEGSSWLPYLPFVQAMRSYVLTRDIEALRKELGPGAADIARIVYEIRERLDVEVRPPGVPEEERYRLMQAVTDFLVNAATVQPLLVVLEDLQNADKGTLEMLTHVSRNLTGTRLFLVGTYRDVEVDRVHPLSATVAELRRVSAYGRVVLRGLNVDEVHRMLESIAGHDVPSGLAEAVHRQTEGNPLFVQEVVRYLAEEGIITRERGRWRAARDTPLEMSIPEGLRDVIGKRLSRLSAECNRLLSVAAVIGREVRLEVLQRVASVSEENLFALLEEAKRAVVVEERTAVAGAVTYRFAHALVRQTLYEEIIAPRRIRLHQEVARTLEEVYASRVEEHAAELAEHFSYSSDSADLKKAVSYGEMAARRAIYVYAYGEAARLLEQALKVQEVLDPEDKAKRCDLLLALAEALILAGEPRRVVDVEAPVAFSLAEAMADRPRASKACLLAAYGLLSYATAWGSPKAAPWAERADRYAEPDTVERAVADAMLGSVKRTASPSLPEGVRLLSRALDLARRLRDPDTFWVVAFCWLLYVSAPQHAEERLRLAEEIAQCSRAGVRTLHLLGPLMHGANTFLQWGQRRRAEEMLHETQALAERTRQANLMLLSMFWDTMWATLDGRLEDALEMSNRIEARGEELGLSEYASAFVRLARLRPRLHLGKAQESYPRTMEGTPTRALVSAHLGRYAEATEILEQLVLTRPGIGTTEDETGEWSDILLVEAAVMVGHHQAAQLLLNRLAGSGLRTTGWRFPTCAGRHLGAAAALLGRPEEARAYYQEVLQVATEMRLRPEIALTRLQLAELLLEHYPQERAEALEHLDFAISEFRDMKMQPALERALRHKEILRA